MRVLVRTLILGANLFLLIALMPVQARADLSITPTRVIFEGRERFANVTLINTGEEQKTYEMSWRYFHMQETGPAYKAAALPPTEFDVSKHIVFTPRRVTLAPGSKQRVRLALRRPENVPEGDFIAHLQFSQVREEPFQSVVPHEDSKRKPRAAVGINISYTIPVIFRSGDIGVDTDISNIELVRNPANNKLTAMVSAERSGGPYGILGHLYLYHKGKDGEEELIGQIANAHIFPEIDRRVFQVATDKHNLAGGSLRVVLEHNDKNPEKRYIYAEKTFPLQ
jgi:P pilus assembly chaperone PapD